MNFLIVESAPYWSDFLAKTLGSLPEASVTVSHSLASTREVLHTTVPDVVLAELVLVDGLSYSLFQDTQFTNTCPIIFLTDFPNNGHLHKALSIPKSTFLIKPFNEEELRKIVDSVLLLNSDEQSNVIEYTQKGLWIRNRFGRKTKINQEDIMYLEADRNYIVIYEKDKKYSFKRSLKGILPELDTRFVQVHKSYIINIDYLIRAYLTEGSVQLPGIQIPIGRRFRKQLEKSLEQ